jgi:hypothetical protein
VSYFVRCAGGKNTDPLRPVRACRVNVSVFLEGELWSISMEPCFAYVECAGADNFGTKEFVRTARRMLGKHWRWIGSYSADGACSDGGGNYRLLLSREVHGLPVDWKERLRLGRDDLVGKIEVSDPYSRGTEESWARVKQGEIVRCGGKLFGTTVLGSPAPWYREVSHGNVEGYVLPSDVRG